MTELNPNMPGLINFVSEMIMPKFITYDEAISYDYCNSFQNVVLCTSKWKSDAVIHLNKLIFINFNYDYS